MSVPSGKFTRPWRASDSSAIFSTVIDCELLCTICAVPVALVVTEAPGLRTVGRAHWTPDGRLFIGDPEMPDAAYCQRCSASVITCRVCGCTDEAACDEGCWWVERDLCSVCSGDSEGGFVEEGAG